MNEFKNVGGYGIVGYFIIVCGLFSLIGTFISRDHRNDDGEWITFKDGLNTALFMFTIGITLVIIDKIKNKKNN